MSVYWASKQRDFAGCYGPIATHMLELQPARVSGHGPPALLHLSLPASRTGPCHAAAAVLASAWLAGSLWELAVHVHPSSLCTPLYQQEDGCLG
jgi:hypothetical protein